MKTFKEQYFPVVVFIIHCTRGPSISLNIQNFYLCRCKPKNSGPILINNFHMSAVKLLRSAFGYRWTGWIWNTT